MTVVKKSAKRALVEDVEFIYHGYTYNKSVITNLYNRGFSRELKGGYKL
jgi:hypothetical protein